MQTLVLAHLHHIHAAIVRQDHFRSLCGMERLASVYDKTSRAITKSKAKMSKERGMECG